MSPPKPTAFLSYARRDDAAHGGKITELRSHLERLVGAAIGQDFEIFQDADGIAWGQTWSERLDEALERSHLLIPIMTPSFFGSEFCVKEVEKFLEMQRTSGRALILPVYFRTARDFDEQSTPIAQQLAKIQYRDLRPYRHLPLEDPQMSHALDLLAEEIEVAVHKSQAAQAETEAGRQRSEPEPPRDATPSDGDGLSARHASVEEPAIVRHARMEPEAEPRPARLEGRGGHSTPAQDEEPRSAAVSHDGGPSDRRGPKEELAAKATAASGTSGYGLASHRRPLIVMALLLAIVAASAVTWFSWPKYQPGETFRDCAECPEMVVIPAGAFMMGSPEDEEGRDDDEGPQHKVTFDQPFAIGESEVTFEQWDACVAGGGCDGYRPDDGGWGRGERPVINVSWEDAQAYVAWLSEVTGEAYRLPSEAEWEYAARAGTTTRYAFGDDITPEQANYYPNVSKTTPVGSYKANGWGLTDMHGNVWEWVEDCGHDSYAGAPLDGSAWKEGACTRRVVRGGSWDDFPEDLRSALRLRDVPDLRYLYLGFRVSRMLTP